MSILNMKYESFVKITKLSQKNMKQLVNWFNRQNILIQNDVLAEQRNQYFKLKNNGVSSDLLSICSFYLSLDKLKKTDNLNFKNNNLNIKNLEQISDNSIKKFQKNRIKEKKEKLLNYCNVIKKLRSKNFSFRQISEYLRGHHRFEVSHTYVANFWNEFKNES